jgi:RND superfamily putative drug exporter
VIGIWLLLAVASGPLQGLLEERSTNSSSSFLPASADSTKVVDLLRDGDTFDDGEQVPAIVVVQSPGGEEQLTPEQEQAAQELVASLEADLGELPTASSVISPWSMGGPPGSSLRSEDGTTVLVFVNLEAPDSEQIDAVVEDLRERVEPIEEASADVYVSGPAALATDATAAFAGIDGKLLLGTSILVLVLLLLIYRSPLVALVPLVAVGIAAALARAVLGWSIEPFDLTVSGQTSGIMLILIFGAGTDYCLLIVARYREELLRFADPHDAMRETVRHTTPAILSSAGTVVLAMVVLLFAELRSTASLGPALIIGVTIAMLAGLTLLPALLLAIGRRSFWPSIPRYGDAASTKRTFWPRLADSVSVRPWPWLVTVTAVLVVFSAGLLTQQNQPTSEIDLFIDQPESVQGLDALEGKLPGGDLAQGTVLVGSTDPSELERDTAAVIDALQTSPIVAEAFPGSRGQSGDTTWQQVRFAPEGNPYAQAAVDEIEPLRTQLDEAVTGDSTVYVGGPTAETADAQATNARDLRIIVPGVLAVIALVLVVLLRAIVAPALLVGTVVLGFAATLGICWVLFLGILGQPGIDPGTVTFIFLFTAALGIDYNIFLVARIREEYDRSGDTVDATRRALASTGGVITSAGVILAGTFLILAALPLLPLRQLGLAVAIGVLLDTVLIRAMLVPAALTLLGDHSWWPSKRAHRSGELHS